MEEERQTKQFANIFIGVVMLVVIVFFGYGFLITRNETSKQSVNAPTPTIAFVDYLQYKGKTGKNALELLNEQASVQQATSGLVVAINGRKADNTQREYWGFFVNGKMATVGPLEYETKDEDVIEWKIEKY